MPFNCQIKIHLFFFRVHVHMAIPYHTTKFKSTNSVKNVVWGKTAKFNDHQYSGYTVECMRMLDVEIGLYIFGKA